MSRRLVQLREATLLFSDRRRSESLSSSEHNSQLFLRRCIRKLRVGEQNDKYISWDHID